MDTNYLIYVEGMNVAGLPRSHPAIILKTPLLGFRLGSMTPRGWPLFPTALTSIA